MLTNRYNLGFFPTPLQSLKNLSANYSDYSIFIKRDDITGLASGGNKTRKLEYLIQAALQNGCDTVITAGAQQSNHCRQTVAACAKAGLECHLLLGGKEPEKYDGNLLLSHILGAHIHFTGKNRKGEDIDVVEKRLKASGKKSYVIPYGGSNFTGALGFVTAVKELKNQLKQTHTTIDYIFFASSSGGMQAGLTLGVAKYNLTTTLVPIRIDKERNNGRSIQESVLSIVRSGAELLNIDRDFTLSDIPLITGYDEAGYGQISEDEKSVLHELAQQEGILLDPVYTARAFYAMLDHLKQHKIKKGANVLFWHSGGFPAIFEYADQIQLR
ncbi:D-cysteine desulfhydrase family protein [Aquimarina intermedia]|uniref:D-cysteine desulfhydrase n=1 Tax=Aquimarina intermedia TaxID=350814 RepID=A0A5S5BXH1_9FLAO|nr:D-cysteine desulfhydrase family protein [Aquimarina intermedia]TYP71659.1 D-cysteine desulfhydrase [Aquimarina intermedia]